MRRARSTSTPWVSSAARAVGGRRRAGWTIRSSDGRMRRRSPSRHPPRPSPSPSPSRPRPRAWRPPRAVAGAGPPRARPPLRGARRRAPPRASPPPAPRRVPPCSGAFVGAGRRWLERARSSPPLGAHRWEEACRRSRSTAAAAGPRRASRAPRSVARAGWWWAPEGRWTPAPRAIPPRGACGGWHRPARGASSLAPAA